MAFEKKFDLGLVLLDMEGWSRASLSPDFKAVKGRKKLEEAFGAYSENFLDCIDTDSRKTVEGCSAAGPDAMVNWVGFSRSGAPFEFILADRGGAFELLYKGMENRIRSLERLAIFYRNFLTTPTAICFTNKSGSIVDVNRAFLDLYGYSLREVKGKNPRILKSGRHSPAIYGEMWRSISDKKTGSWTGELINRKKNGEEVSVLLTISAVKRADGSLIGYVASTVDITRRKKLEAEIIRKNNELVELNRLAGELVAVTSHDLKSPLNSMISRARLMRESVRELSPEKLLEHIEQLIASGLQLTDFVDNLLDLGKIESGLTKLNTGRVHLYAVLKSCVETNLIIARSNGIKISVRAVGTPQPMVVDIVKMEQVFNNLLSNALKVSPPGSEIEAVYTELKGGTKRVEIKDKGPGLPEDDLKGIFDKYYQVKKKESVPTRGFGFGLGLSIVKNFVELHGGTIHVENRPAGGCIFTVDIPDSTGISPGNNLAAMIHDPAGDLFKKLERPLKIKGISCFITRNEYEARRVHNYERPEIIFVSHVSLSADMENFLSSVRKDQGDKTVIVDISGSESRHPLYDRTVITPLTDFDVYDVLKEVYIKAQERGSAHNVLIIDDDPNTHDVLGEYLHAAGFGVMSSKNAPEAFALLEDRLPDLILLDIRMPEIDGFQAMELIKKDRRLHNIPVIFITSLGSKELITKGLEMGAEDYIRKPFDKAEVLARIKAALHRSGRYKRKEGVIEGDLSDISMFELLQTMDLGRKTARINFESADGAFYVEKGKILFARQGEFTGKDALYRLLSLEKGEFEILFGKADGEMFQEPMSIESVLLEAAVYLDEVKLTMSCFPPNNPIVDIAPEAPLPPELEKIRKMFPIHVSDLMLIMKGGLRENAVDLAKAYRSGILKAAE